MKWITLADFARRIRVRWRVAYRLVTSGKVKARSERRGGKLRWYVAERAVAAIRRDWPWQHHLPTRFSGPAGARLPARSRRKTASAFKRLP